MPPNRENFARSKKACVENCGMGKQWNEETEFCQVPCDFGMHYDKKRMRVFVARMGPMGKCGKLSGITTCAPRAGAAVGVMRKTAAKLGKLCQIQSHRTRGNSRMRHGSSGAEKFARCIWEEEVHGVS